MNTNKGNLNCFKLLANQGHQSQTTKATSYLNITQEGNSIKRNPRAYHKNYATVKIHNTKITALKKGYTRAMHIC